MQYRKVIDTMLLRKAQCYRILSIIVLFTFLRHDALLAYALDTEPTPTQDAKAAGPTFYIKQILIENAKFLSKKNKQKLVAPYLNNHLGADKISKLVQELRAFYIKKGYLTTQAKVVIGQNLQDGILKLVVVNGFIEAIKLNKHTPRDQAKVATAFPLLKGKPLYLKHLEQGIDQMNALPSSNATLKILPGLQEGGSIIQIDNVVIHPFRLDIGIDNLGEKEAGQWRGRVNIGLDNLFSINDNLTLHYASSKARALENRKLGSKALMASFSFPLGYYTCSTTHSMDSSIIPAKTGRHTSPYRNENHSHSYEVKRRLHKTSAHKTLLFIGLTHRKTASYLRDVLISIQNSKCTHTKLGTNHTGLLFSGLYVLDIAYHQGVDWLGAQKDVQPQQPGSPKAQFKKLCLHLFWMRPFSLLRQRLSYQFSFSAQYSQDELLGPDQWAITGLEHVRGFQERYSGKKGLCLRQEISLHNPCSFSPLLLPLQLLVALDIGYLPKVSSPDPKLGNKPAALVSWACGCKYNSTWLSADFTVAKPLKKSKHLANNAYQAYINTTLKLHTILRLRSTSKELPQ